MSAADLVQKTGLSQPSVFRAIQRAPQITGFKLEGRRAPLYARLREDLPLDLSPKQPVYRVDSAGAIERFADVELLFGGGVLERKPSGTKLYTGVPPYMAFAAPSGFLGRQMARSLSDGLRDLGLSSRLPSSLADWSDKHRVEFLFTHGRNLPGNLIFGDIPLCAEMDLMREPGMPQALLDARYLVMARSLKAGAFGASAGGEQPKFLEKSAERGQLIVKFAKRGTRMGELLALEHLALCSMEACGMGVSAAQTSLKAIEDLVFLEVERFDRVGSAGRRAMLSAASIDDEFFGRRDSWSEFARRCEQIGILDADQALQVDKLAAFSELIGNTDRHFENLSLMLDDEHRWLRLSPAYDILPSRYSPIGGGIDPDLGPITPRIGTIGARPGVWSDALRAAEVFWQAAAAQEGLPDGLLSLEMRNLAQENLSVARVFAKPLADDASHAEDVAPKTARRNRPKA